MDSDIALILPAGVKYHHHQDVDIVAWSYKKTPVDKGQIYTGVIALLLLSATALFMTFQLFSGVLSDETFYEIIFTIVFTIIMWVAAAGVLAFLFSFKTWVEAIHISEEDIILRYSGNGTPKSRKFSKKSVLGLAFKNPHALGHDTDEVLPSLNMFYAKQNMGSIEERHVDFAIWMRPEEKYQLFLLLQHILKERGWNITYRLDNRPF